MSWEIDWYNCTEEGKLLWRVAQSIGPLYPDHNHWSGPYIEGDESEILLAAAAPTLWEALEAAFVQTDDDVFYRTAGGISQDVPERIARKVRLAFAEVKKGNTT